MVFATAVRLLGNPTEAEDVAQTVFMRAFQRFEEIGPSPTAAGWLKTVTRNTCLNHLSRYRRRWRLFSELATTDETRRRPRSSGAAGGLILGHRRPGAVGASRATRAGASRAAGSPARAAGVVSLRGAELSGHRRCAGRLARQSEDGHSSRPRGAASVRWARSNVNSFELERFVSRQLRALPTPSAPRTLLPRVLAAARAWSERPWYAREWFTWPLGWQLGSVAVLALTVVGGVAMVPAMQSLVADAMPCARPPRSRSICRDLPADSHVSANVLRVIWRAVVQPLLPYAFVVVVLMSAACATVAIALNRDDVRKGSALMMRMFSASRCLHVDDRLVRRGRPARLSSSRANSLNRKSSPHGAPSGLSTRSLAVSVFRMSCASAATTR